MNKNLCLLTFCHIHYKSFFKQKNSTTTNKIEGFFFNKRKKTLQMKWKCYIHSLPSLLPYWHELSIRRVYF